MASRTNRSQADRSSADRTPPPAGDADAVQRLDELLAAVSPFVAPATLVDIQRQLVAGDPPPPDEATLSALLMFSIDLSVFAAPPGRSTGAERLGRHLRPARGSLDARLLDGMAQSRLALFTLAGAAGNGRHTAHDLFTGEALSIAGGELDGITRPAGVRLAARLVPFDSGFLIAGIVIPLDDGLIDAVRPRRSANGRGWTSAARAAETLYRHVLRHGCPLVAGLNADAEGREPFPLSPEDGPVHALAHHLAGLPAEQWAAGENLAAIRTLAKDGDEVLDALQGAHLAGRTGRPGLVGSYEHILTVMLDVLQRRAGIGQRGSADLLAWLDAEVALGIANGEIPPDVRDLYQRLKRNSAAASAGSDSVELDRLRGRIQALRAKTVDQGCTEEEALAAADKVAELLERYGLSLSDLDLRRQTCEGFGVETGRRQRMPIDDAIGTLASFCDCRHWNEVTPAGTIRYVFFGLPADVEGARYLYDLVAATVDGETAAFRASDLYREHAPGGQRTSAVRSFQTGLVHGIVDKLHRLKQERAAARIPGSRDLVPVKESAIDEEMDKLGLAFQTRKVRKRRVLKDAFAAGQEAGEAFEVRPGIHDGPAPVRRRRS